MIGAATGEGGCPEGTSFCPVHGGAVRRIDYIPQTEITMAPITIRQAPINL
jgi:hypothetical protein